MFFQESGHLECSIADGFRHRGTAHVAITYKDEEALRGAQARRMNQMARMRTENRPDFVIGSEIERSVITLTEVLRQLLVPLRSDFQPASSIMRLQR